MSTTVGVQLRRREPDARDPAAWLLGSGWAIEASEEIREAHVFAHQRGVMTRSLGSGLGNVTPLGASAGWA